MNDRDCPFGRLSTTHTQLVACSRLVVGVEPDAGRAGSGPGTLLSPEASAVRQVSLARRDRIATVVAVGSGGFVSCELDSGREHLRNNM
jgi:hypothetical protein